MTSIRRRMTLPIMLGLMLLAIATGFGCYGYAHHVLEREFDTALEAKARAIATLVEIEQDKKIRIEFSEQNMPEFTSKNSPQYFQVWLPDGTTLARSTSLKGDNIPRRKKDDRSHQSYNIVLPNGKNGRVVQLRFRPQLEIDEYRPTAPPPDAPKCTVAVARDRQELDGTLHILILMIVTATVFLPLVAAFIVYGAVRWGLRPVDEMAKAITEVETPAGFRPLPVADLPQELKPIAVQLNSMMERLKAAFDRERQFTRDASHELRTPLSEVRTALEVALKWQSDQELMANSCRDALSATRDMERLVTALLALARSETGAIQPQTESVDVCALIESCWGRLENRAGGRRLDLCPGQEGRVIVTADSALLTAVMTNLLDNAISYSPAGSTIKADVQQDETGARVEISNETETPLSPDDLDDIYEPLWRKEAARAHAEHDDEASHAGLGLSLVRSFCRIMGVGLSAELPSPSQFKMILTFSHRS